MILEHGTSAPGVSPVEQGRVVERYFDVLPTHIAGFFILVDHGAEPNLTRSQTRRLMELGNAYGARSEIIKQLIELQAAPHDELEKLGIDLPGLRGGRDTNSGFETQINPNTDNIFDEPLLKQSLGDRTTEFVHRKVTVTVELDPDKDDVEGFVTSVKRRLRRQGLSAEEARKRVKTKISLRVDEKALQKLIKTGEVTLLPGAWAIQVTDWDVVPRRIPTQREIAEAEENARSSTDSPS
jgi:hypothetical protein